MAAETQDQYNTRLQQLPKHCNFHEKDRKVKSQIIQRCAMSKVRDKGLSESTITLQRLLTFGRTLEATLQQSKSMGNCSSPVPTPVHAISKYGGDATLHVEVSALHNRWHHTHIEIHQENISRLTVRGRHIQTIVRSEDSAALQTSQEYSTGMFWLWWTATRRSAYVQSLEQGLLQVSEETKPLC